MIQDSFGRAHDYLRISLTDVCNFRCTYCMPKEDMQFMPSAKLMQASEIEAIVKEFVKLGVKKIRLTGGEPLARKDLADILKKLAVYPVELTLTTNGYLLDRHLPDLLSSRRTVHQY
jgi:GTP 3',8-cyclase